MIILNVRGTNASGKTTVVREFLDSPKPTGDFGGVPYAMGLDHDDDLPVLVLGSYQARDGGWAKTGGMDKVRTQDEASMAVRLAAQHVREKLGGRGIVAFEGLLISGLYQRWLDLDVALSRAGHKYAWAFMDTPLETCYERVRARSGKPYDAPKALDNIRTKNVAVQRVKFRAREDGRAVYEIDHRNHKASVTEILRSLR